MSLRPLVVLAATLLLAGSATAETVDELIEKNAKAKGGMEKIKSVQTMRMTGKMIMGQGMEAPFTMTAKRPKNTRVEFTFQGMTGIQAYDGKTAWMVMPFMGKKDPEAMPSEETKNMEEQADFDGPLIDYKAKGHTVELLGKESVEGSDAFKLKVTLKNGEVRTIYLDAETFLEVKAEAKRMVRGTEIEGESLFGDYKEVDGMMVAHVMESGAKGSPQRQKMVFEKVEFNVPLADSLFVMPVVARADSAKATPAAAVDAAKKAAEGEKKPEAAATKKKN
jgi:outer membrane lipoprotein-sorting protein